MPTTCLASVSIRLPRWCLHTPWGRFSACLPQGECDFQMYHHGEQLHWNILVALVKSILMFASSSQSKIVDCAWDGIFRAAVITGNTQTREGWSILGEGKWLWWFPDGVMIYATVLCIPRKRRCKNADIIIIRVRAIKSLTQRWVQPFYIFRTLGVLLPLRSVLHR